MRYLVDTDWVIHYLNRHPEIVSRIEEFGAQGLALSFISLAELYIPTTRVKARRAFERFFAVSNC